MVSSDSDKEGIQINKNRSNIFITRKKVKSSTLKLNVVNDKLGKKSKWTF